MGGEDISVRKFKFITTKGDAVSSQKNKEEIWDEWKDLLNISPAELEDWLATEESKSVGDAKDEESTGHRSGRQILEIKRTRKDELSDNQWDHMAKVIGYIKRHLAQGGPKKDVENSAWRYSLMNWGHDPLNAKIGSDT